MNSVAIIIPTYNRATLVARAVDSVLPQMCAGDELIVVDDGSTDGTENALRGFSGRITYLRKANGGVASARNLGIEKTSAPLVAFLDSDDRWLPGKLESQRRLMDARPDVLYCFSDFRISRDGGGMDRCALKNWRDGYGLCDAEWSKAIGEGVLFSTIAEPPPAMEDFRVHIADLFAAEAKAPCVNTGCMMVRREVAAELLHFDERLAIYEDWWCWLQLAKRGPGAFLDTETLEWNDVHDRTRLTAVEMLVKASARVELLERLDAKDRERFAGLLQERRGHKVAHLLRLGRTSEARAEIAKMQNAPAKYVAMAQLPGFAARAIVSLVKG